MYSSSGAITDCVCGGSIELYTIVPTEIPGAAAIRNIGVAIVERSHGRFHRFTRSEYWAELREYIQKMAQKMVRLYRSVEEMYQFCGAAWE